MLDITHFATLSGKWLAIIAALTSLLMAPVRAEEAGPTYMDLEPSFTINYGQDNRLRYLQTSISLLVPSNAAALEVSAHSDAIRHEIIMLISAQTRETLTSTSGRNDLQQALLEKIQAYLTLETGAPHVEQVLFTSFVIQG